MPHVRTSCMSHKHALWVYFQVTMQYKSVCTHVAHFIKLKPYFFAFFWSKCHFCSKKSAIPPQWQMISRSQNSMFWLVYDLPVPEPDTYDIEERFKTCCLIIKWLDDKRHSILCSVTIFFLKSCFFLWLCHMTYNTFISLWWLNLRFPCLRLSKTLLEISFRVIVPQFFR